MSRKRKSDKRLLTSEFTRRLNSEQRLIFDNVVRKIEIREDGLFFLDAPCVITLFF